MFWPGEKVAKYVKTPPEIKVEANGVELKVAEVWKIPLKGKAIFDGKLRLIKPKKKLVKPRKSGFYILKRGIYELRIANEVEIPKNAVGLMFPRSTLNRLGIIKSETAIWDSGYKGYGTQTIFVAIKEFAFNKEEFLFYLTFVSTKGVKKLYSGYYQGEKLLTK